MYFNQILHNFIYIFVIRNSAFLKYAFGNSYKFEKLLKLKNIYEILKNGN